MNDYAHCSHVILAGVLQRSPVDLAAAYLGQRGTLEGDVQNSLVADLSRSEVCHAIYQALSRGTCRTVDDGRALPMEAWIIHRDSRIRQELEAVMPGARWVEWKPNHVAPSAPLMTSLSGRIGAYLEGIGPEVVSMSTRKLKEALDAKAVPAETWRRALHHCLENGAAWMLSGRSIRRASAVFA